MDDTNPITQIDFIQAHIETLKEQLAKKDAMIDWLAQYLCKIHKTNYIPEYIVAKNYSVKCWKEAAQEAVKKND